MNDAIRIFLVLLIIEFVVCGYLVAQQVLRVEPVLPSVEFDDPLFKKDLEKLVDKARQGDHVDWQTFGEAMMGEGFYSHAEVAFRQSLKMNSENVISRFGLAFCLNKTGRTTQSTEQFQTFLATKSKLQQKQLFNQYALYAIGQNDLREGKLSEAEKTFKRNKNYSAAEYQLAKLMIRDKRAEEAMPLIEKNIEQLPFSLKWHYLNYYAMEKLNRPEEAQAAAQMVERAAYLVSLSFNNIYVQSINAQYGLPREIKRFQERQSTGNIAGMKKSIAVFTEALEGRNHQMYPMILINHIDVAIAENSPNRVLATVEKIKALGISSPEILFFEGKAYAMQDKMDEAAIRWERVLSMSPKAEIHSVLASYYKKKKNKSQADSHRSKALLINGISLFRENKLPEAIKKIKASTAINANDAQAWYYLGILNRYLGETEQAKNNLQHCLKLNPYYGRAKRNLAMIK